jgi:hypothetical protein
MTGRLLTNLATTDCNISAAGDARSQFEEITEDHTCAKSELIKV